MSDLQTVCNRIRNAKNNLGNAEKSFSSNKKVRGELDLMLAEAELTSLRRKNRSNFNWTRQFMAVCLALLLTGAGAFGWWWASSFKAPNPAGTFTASKNGETRGVIGSTAGDFAAGTSVKAGSEAEYSVSGRAERGSAVFSHQKEILNEQGVSVPSASEKMASAGAYSGTASEKMASDKAASSKGGVEKSASARIGVSKDKMWELVRSGKQELSNTF